MKKIIPYGRQFIDSKDIEQVSIALKKEKITTGEFVKKFELAIKNNLNSKYAISCNSGTSAIHLSLIAIDTKKNDVIIMPVINFIAAYSMCQNIGANVFFADVDPITGQATPETVTNCIKINKLKKIKAIFVMWNGGYPQYPIEFYKIKKKYNCYLIEDACHALGAKYLYNKRYYKIGSCKHSDISTFSLHPVKTITSGEGGIVTTNNHSLFKKMVLARSHNIIRNKKFHWKYTIKSTAYNYRLSDLNCALALSQLKKLEKFLNFRKKIFRQYEMEFKPIKDLLTIPTYKNIKPAYHLFIVSINFNKIKSSKDNFFSFLKKNKILAQFHYIPIYRLGLLKEKIKKSLYDGAEYYYKNSVSLPIFFNMTKKMQKKIIKKTTFFLQKNK